jgi:methyltransferase
MSAVVPIAFVVFAPMLAEALLASRNERVQRARGAVEPAGDVYPLMRVVYPASFLAMLIEGGRAPAPPAWLAAGLAIFAAAKLIKWWAIAALGPRWTFRVVAVPGDRLITSGPYRYLRHPNYVGVVGELVGAAMMTHALVSGTVSIAAFGALLRRRIGLERRFLNGGI